MRRVLQLFLIAVILLWPYAAKADPENGFLLHFIFTPPYVPVGSMPTPAIDVCTDNLCRNVVAVIQPKCLAKSDAPSASVKFIDCAAYAFIEKTDAGIVADVNMSLLSNPAMLRLRMDNVVSAPFFFKGGEFRRPLAEYVFFVQHSGMTLTITPY